MSDRETGKAVVLPPDDEAMVPLRFRFDGWTAARQRNFLAALGETGCIRDACRRVGMSKTSAYRLRRRSDEFAEEWDAALDRAATVLEQVAYERAVIGLEEPVYHYGKLVGMRRRYSDSLLRLLIQRGDLANGRNKTRDELVADAHGAARLAGGHFSNEDGGEAAFAKLARQLDQLASHGRREEAARAEQWLAEGKIP